MGASYYESSARERLMAVLDQNSFQEFIAPTERLTSPHMAQLGQPVAFDDGLIAGRAMLGGKSVFALAQEGAFLGGAIGEVHGAKFAATLAKAVKEKVAAVVILFESGGVRLHEANAGLIAVSEIMRAALRARSHGVQLIGLIGGAAGCFGGTGLIARCCDVLIMSEEGRLSMSGPEVIETVHGVEEFDSRDRALVWRVTGGKHRYVLGEADELVADDVDAFKAAALAALQAGAKPFDLPAVQQEHARLAQRIERFDQYNDAQQIWAELGLPAAAELAMMTAAEFTQTTAQVRRKLTEAQ